MFLLALVTGLPAISARVWTGIEQPRSDVHKLGRLAELVEKGATPGDDKKQARALVQWLGQGMIMGGDWSDLDLTTLAGWLEPIGRFTFGSETANEALSTAPIPAGPARKPATRRAAAKAPRK
jgi:hypothetical protein